MSETNKFYQYDRNDNNTFGVRGTASGGGTEVVANPTLAGTESALTGLKVGETKYKVEQPINVVANPTLAGTESALTGLEVGSTKYKIFDIPTVTITASQVISQNLFQLTNEQYNIFANNKQVIIDTSVLGIDVSVIWSYSNEGTGEIYFTNLTSSGDLSYMLISINKSTYQAQLSELYREVYPNNIIADSLNAGLLLGIANNGLATPTNSLPILTTAPSSANTEGLKIVVLTSEPATYYNGYYYIIAPTT